MTGDFAQDFCTVAPVVAFDMVYSRQHPGGAFSAFTGVGKGMRLGRELARAFATALRAAGAADETGSPR